MAVVMVIVVRILNGIRMAAIMVMLPTCVVVLKVDIVSNSSECL